MARGRADAVVVANQPFQYAHRARIAELAIKHRLPAMYRDTPRDAGVLGRRPTPAGASGLDGGGEDGRHRQLDRAGSLVRADRLPDLGADRVLRPRACWRAHGQAPRSGAISKDVRKSMSCRRLCHTEQ